LFARKSEAKKELCKLDYVGYLAVETLAAKGPMYDTFSCVSERMEGFKEAMARYY
jgi:hypothetical protein